MVGTNKSVINSLNSFYVLGTTVATNAILEGKGARVALLVTEGYKDVLQVRRSQVPGGLAGWFGIISHKLRQCGSPYVLCQDRLAQARASR